MFFRMPRAFELLWIPAWELDQSFFFFFTVVFFSPMIKKQQQKNPPGHVMTLTDVARVYSTTPPSPPPPPVPACALNILLHSSSKAKNRYASTTPPRPPPTSTSTATALSLTMWSWVKQDQRSFPETTPLPHLYLPPQQSLPQTSSHGSNQCSPTGAFLWLRINKY